MVFHAELHLLESTNPYDHRGVRPSLPIRMSCPGVHGTGKWSSLNTCCSPEGRIAFPLGYAVNFI